MVVEELERLIPKYYKNKGLSKYLSNSGGFGKFEAIFNCDSYYILNYNEIELNEITEFMEQF